MSNYLNEMTDVHRSDDPEVIRRDIEATRADLSRDVDALTEKVSPARWWSVGSTGQGRGRLGEGARYGFAGATLRRRS